MFYQKQEFQYGDFVFISQLLNDMKYVFTGTLKKQCYFILFIEASEWRAYCFQTLLKMERTGIRKVWGAHLVGGYLLAQPGKHLGKHFQHGYFVSWFTVSIFFCSG